MWPLTRLAIGILAVPSPAHADWPQYRHDAAHTGYTDEVVKPPLELRWRREVPFPRTDLAYDAKRALWRQGELPTPQLAVLYRDGLAGKLHCRDSLLAADESLFFSAHGFGCLCLDTTTGETIWESRPRDLVALERGVLVEWVDRWPGWVGGADPDTGERTWELRGPEPPAGVTVAVGDGRVCMVGHHLLDPEDLLHWSMYLLSVSDGSVIDKLDEDDLAPRGSRFFLGCCDTLAWCDDTFILRSWNQWEGTNDLPLPVDAASYPGPWALHQGRISGYTPLDAAPMSGVWDPYSNPTFRAPAVALCAPLSVVAAWEGERGLVLAGRDALTGRLLWSREVPARHHPDPPAVDRTTAFFGLNDGVVYAVDLATGEVAWRTQVGTDEAVELARCPYGPAVPHPDSQDGAGWGVGPGRWRWWGASARSCRAPACSVAGDTVWVVYMGRLLALSTRTGRIRWHTDQTTAGWFVAQEPVIHKGFVYLTTGPTIEAWAAETEDTDERAGR